MHQKRGGGNCSFWLHDVQKDRYLYFLPYKCNQKRTKKLFLLTTWRMALFTKEHFFGSFLNVIFLEKKVICTFCLAKCIRKRQKNCSFWLHEVKKERHLYFLPCQMHQKRTKNCSFWLHDVQKNVICTFSLTKCIRKGQKNCSFWLHEEWLSSQKEHFFVPFWMSSF